MTMIANVKKAAHDGWPHIFQSVGIDVPAAGKHGACPACGGNDRFHFINDHGGGEWHCRQCDMPNHGDGLDLICRVKGVGVLEAAKLVAGVLGIDTRAPISPSNQGAKPEVDRRQVIDASAEKKRQQFKRRYHEANRRTVQAESPYLKAKGLNGFTFPIQHDGSLLLPLVDGDGVITGAQSITPTGEKRLLADSVMKGSFVSVGTPPAAPEIIIIAEGIATALSAGLMCSGYVVAAINAGNLSHVAKAVRQQYPQAKIIIAADNDWHLPDELDEHGKPKKNMGKLAAESAAKCVSGWIALPPTEYKTDWDDHRQNKGLEAATRDFMNCLCKGEDENKTTPPASAAKTKAHIESRADGIYWVTPKQDKETGDIIHHAQWLCSPLTPIGIGREDQEQYLILRWLPKGATAPMIKAVPLADIGEREGWRTLKAGGVTVTTKSAMRAVLADWLQRHDNLDVWRISHASGWQYGAYILPNGDIIGTPETPVIFHGRSAAAIGYSVRGTAASWRDSVAALARGNPSMMIGLAAAFAAPLIGLVEADGFGLHLYEQSSAGKTTTANIASSLYGSPDALRLTWYGTALGIANEAEAHNDGLLPLDEVGQGSDPKSVSVSAYTLFNGVGKIQGAKDGGNRDLKRWRTVAISTGEMDIETFLLSGGMRVKAGQLVRLLNIPMEKAIQYHGHPNGKDHADALRTAWIAHHGAAGRAWIAYLATHPQEASDAVRHAESRWRALIPADYGEQVHRVAARFALMEAALLLGRVVTGWDEQECRDAIQHNFNAWVKEFGTGNREHQQIIEQCEAFLNAHGLSRFAPYPYSSQDLPIRDLAGYRSNDNVTFYTFPAAFEDEIAKGFNSKQFAKVLAISGMLTMPTSGKGYQRKSPRIDGRQINVYVLNHLPESEP